MNSFSKIKVGELRPSQLLYTFGVGSIVELPNMAIMVMGLEDWPVKNATPIVEKRLLSLVKRVLGEHIQKFLTPPSPP
ncbi:MAG: hypothetical protein D6785_11995, partial [Planctomycetota bacterium]